LVIGVLGKTVTYHLRFKRFSISLDETRPDLRDCSSSFQNSGAEYSMDSKRSAKASLSRKKPFVLNPPLLADIKRTNPFRVFWGLWRNWERLATFSFSNNNGKTIFVPPDQNKYNMLHFVLSRFLLLEAEAAESQCPDLLWDPIISIEPVGLERVYDIEVEGTHNFIGNGIFAHNTAIFPAAQPVVSAPPASSPVLPPGQTDGTGGPGPEMDGKIETSPNLTKSYRCTMRYWGYAFACYPHTS
jgi:hypothetical protein